MTTVQDQYAAFARSSQEATLAVVDAWSRSFRDIAVKLPAVTAQASTHEAIDQVFDLAVTLINVQRDLIKQLATATSAAVEDAVGRATKAAAEASTIVANAQWAPKSDE